MIYTLLCACISINVQIYTIISQHNPIFEKNDAEFQNST